MNYKNLLLDAKFFTVSAVELFANAVKCEYAKIRQRADDVLEFCGTCKKCAAIRAILKAAIFGLTVLILHPAVAVALLAVYLYMAT
mgnify:CR=1 FL=1